MRLSLLLRIYLSTAVAVTALFAVSIWYSEAQASEALRGGVEAEVRDSLRTVDEFRRSHEELLSSVSTLLASMSDVRAAFGTRDAATIRDTAGELWARVSAGHRDTETASFVVADPQGVIIASLGSDSPPALANGRQLPADLLASIRNSAQTSSVALWDGILWQVILTPVFVSSGGTNAMLNILMAAHPIREKSLQALKNSTGGDFLLRVRGKISVSTLPPAEAAQVIAHSRHYVTRTTDLQDASGKVLGQLWAVRSLAAVERRVAGLRRTFLIAWLVAMTAALLLSYLLARRMIGPIHALDDAAAEVGRENYSVRVPEGANDELGVLARTFNRMAASIESARIERSRREQMTAIGRLAASVAHDLRNPLAAVLGGAEMLAEFDLPPEQARQTATHVHQASKRMQTMLAELTQVGVTKPGQRTECRLEEIVRLAVESQSQKASQLGVRIDVEPSSGPSVFCEKNRIERVLINLIANALEVMPGGGEIRIRTIHHDSTVFVDVSDHGPGVPAEIRHQLFQPFVTAGKKGGLGLGLALARQTMLDHRGDLELLPSAQGAHFRLSLPLA